MHGDGATVLLFRLRCDRGQGQMTGVKVSEKTRRYEIAGNTGAALLAAIDAHGPKHGFLTRAIAQTPVFGVLDDRMGQDLVGVPAESKVSKATLDIIYTYPRRRPPVPPGLERRWARFPRRREEAREGAWATWHGRWLGPWRMGRQAVDRQRSRLSQDAAARSGTATAAIYAAYEARQIKFDVRGASRRQLPRRSADRGPWSGAEGFSAVPVDVQRGSCRLRFFRIRFGRPHREFDEHGP